MVVKLWIVQGWFNMPRMMSYPRHSLLVLVMPLSMQLPCRQCQQHQQPKRRLRAKHEQSPGPNPKQKQVRLLCWGERLEKPLHNQCRKLWGLICNHQVIGSYYVAFHQIVLVKGWNCRSPNMNSSLWIFVRRTEPTKSWCHLRNFSREWDIGGYSSRTYLFTWLQIPWHFFCRFWFDWSIGPWKSEMPRFVKDQMKQLGWGIDECVQSGYPMWIRKD